MFRTATRILALVGVGLVASAHSASAQPVAVQWSATTLTPADRARINTTILRADTLLLENKVAEAGKLYWSVVAEQRAAEEYPVYALSRLAALYFGTGEEYAAAAVLSELAESAAAFGDPSRRLQALFDASLLYRNVGRTDRVADCVRQIRPLLKSLAISETTRAKIANQILVR